LTTNTTQTIITDGSFHHQPKKVPGSAKYAGFRPGVGKGMYTARSFPGTESLNPKLRQALIQAANNSLAETTWRQYKTAERHLERCQRNTGVRMSFPMKRTQILCFVAFMLEVRKVKAVTVSKTLSAIRTLHLIEGRKSDVKYRNNLN